MSQLHNTEYHMAPGANVGVRLYDLRDMPCRPEEIKEGEIDKVLAGIPTIAKRESHNILTNIGRTWLRNLSGAASYGAIDAGTGYIEGTGYALTSERVAYLGLGVGGSFSSAPYFATQEELVTVSALEDYVQITDAPTYLKTVLPQTTVNGSFPDSYTIRFSTILASSEVSFATNVSKSAQAVGTNVPVSEAGLYISGATPTENLDHVDNNTRLVAYNIFTPIPVTPNVVLRIDWDFLF